MNVQTRKEFDAFLKDLRENEVKVFDFETNGLFPYNGNQIISMSIYFPAVDRSYNLPFRHGVGNVEIKYNDKNTPDVKFEDMSWQGNTKKSIYLNYWFEKFAAQYNFKNLPIEWLEEIKAAWGTGMYMGHNTRFDAHFAYTEGFPDMNTFYDTMIALHIVNEDWGGIELVAPYTYTAKDKTKGLCTEDQVGAWARDAEGKLLQKKQMGRRGLKWQAARIGLTGATEGETGLRAARLKFERELATFIVEHWQDKKNEGIFTKAIINGLQSGDVDAYYISRDKAIDKVLKKIEIDDKAQMWMLPSHYVSHYAELDVTLTWGLWNWCLPIIEEWDNTELFERISYIHQHVAWEMERRGVKLDHTKAQEEIAKLEPRIKDIDDLFPINIGSPDQLLEYLNSGVLAQEWDTWPEWFPEEKRKGLKTYSIGVQDFDLEEQYDPIEGTNKAELYKVQDHGIVRLVKEYRMLNKSVNTYLKKWIAIADSGDFVHPQFNTDGTGAGRMSSSGAAGNFQNIPDRNGYTIKRAFIAPEDYLIGAYDYGQLELRLACWVAEVTLKLDPKMTMTSLFLSGEDMHSYTRDMVNVRKVLYGDKTDEEIVVILGYSLNSPDANTPAKRAKIIDKWCRFVAKTMNFGLLYNGGAPMLMKLLKIDDVDAAKSLVYAWRNLYPAFPKASRYFTDLAQTYRPNPSNKSRLFVQQPISGRFRKFDMYPTWKSYFKDGQWQGFNPQDAAQKKVWNNTIQGLGGYICTDAAARFTEQFGKDRLMFFAQIHDALEFYVRKDSLHLVTELGKIMMDYPITPELTVDFSSSTDGTWQEMTKVVNFDLWSSSGGTQGYEEQ